MTESAHKQGNATESYEELNPVEKLVAIMAMLRDQQAGCPWDLEQTIASLAPYTIEEVYEVVDAIEKNDMVDLEDELGDLLFQVIFYAQIASEEGKFDFNDIAAAITRKLIRRHPHVFPGGDVSRFGKQAELSPDEVVSNWELIKKQEREEKQSRRGHVPVPEADSVLHDVPRALPALERAKKLQKRAASHGFDWPEIAPVLSKLKEEIAEFEQALLASDKQHLEHELGDIFFAAVNLARHTGIEPEAALRGANKRFEERFQWIEKALQQANRKLDDASLEELDRLWDKAKKQGL